MTRMRRDVQIVTGLQLACLSLAVETQAGGTGQQQDPFGFVSWSYQKPGGLACPVETIRSMRTFGVVNSAVMSSPGPACGNRANKFPFGGVTVIEGSDGPRSACEVEARDSSYFFMCFFRKSSARGQAIFAAASL
jgi:hypothetical protein